MDVLDLEGIDDDLEVADYGESDLDRPMSRLSVLPESATSANDLRLGRRVLELEKERDVMAAEIKLLKARQGPRAISTTIAVPQGGTTVNIQEGNDSRIEVPQALLPILNVMRHHISELARDNHALRYTLGLTTGDENTATSSKVTLDTPQIGTTAGVDLEEVVKRVRGLIVENEELGDMVLEAGKAGTEEWEQTLSDSRKVIESLDADLTHQAEIIQKQKEQLDAYTNKYGPLHPAPMSTTTTITKGRELIDTRPQQRGGSGTGSGSGDRHRGHGQGHGPRPSHSGAGDQSRHRDRDRDRDRDRGKEREKDRGGQRGGPSSGPGQGRGGQGGDFGPGPGMGQGGRREDERDRASKRRR